MEFKKLLKNMEIIKADNELIKTIEPKADIYDLGNQIVVILEMPGILNNSLSVTLEERGLDIEAMKNKISGKTVLNEIKSENYKRKFILGDNIDEDSIKAVYQNGCLKIYLNKVDQKIFREIRIN